MIVPKLAGSDVPAMLRELSELLHREGCVPDLPAFLDAVWEREQLTSTAMDFGMAFPHARMSGLNRLAFALGRCEQPIPWGAKGAKSVDLVFVIAVPIREAKGNLHLLSTVAKLTKHGDRLAELRSARTSAQMLAVLARRGVSPGNWQ